MVILRVGANDLRIDKTPSDIDIKIIKLVKDIKGNGTEVISYLIPHSDHLSGKIKKVKKIFKMFIILKGLSKPVIFDSLYNRIMPLLQGKITIKFCQAENQIVI